jgi:hypothetical protein
VELNCQALQFVAEGGGMCTSSLVIVVSAILAITVMGSIAVAQDTADPCSQGGVYIVNLSVADLWYKRDGGDCTLWQYSKFNIPIRPGERIEVFSDLTCQTAICPEPLTYQGCKSVDRNGNCLIKVDYGCRLLDA